MESGSLSLQKAFWSRGRCQCFTYIPIFMHTWRPMAVPPASQHLPIFVGEASSGCWSGLGMWAPPTPLRMSSSLPSFKDQTRAPSSPHSGLFSSHSSFFVLVLGTTVIICLALSLLCGRSPLLPAIRTNNSRSVHGLSHRSQTHTRSPSAFLNHVL